MKQSEQVNEIAEALALASAELANPKMDRVNSFYKSKYATLAEVRNTVTPVLAKNGLSVIQSPFYIDNRAGVSWVLMHKSGQWYSGELSLPLGKADAQGVGIAITYARRYTLQAITGTVGDEDDDANGIVDPPKGHADETEPKGKPPKPKAKPKEPDATPLDTLRAALKPTATGTADWNAYSNWLSDGKYAAAADLKTATDDELVAMLTRFHKAANEHETKGAAPPLKIAYDASITIPEIPNG